VTSDGAVADGTSSIRVTTVVEDAFGNPVPGQSVSVGSDSPNATLAPPSGVTGADGVFTTYITSPVAGSQAVTAVVNGGAVTTSAPIAFVPGGASVGHSTFDAAPSPVVADGVASATLTVVLRDAHDNPIPNTLVNLLAGGTSNTLSPATGTTDANGTLVATLLSTRAELKALLAAANGTLLGTTATFVAGPASGATSSLSPTLGTVVADGTSADTLVLTVLDAYGNPVVGQPVQFTDNGTNITLSPTATITDASGHASVTVTSTAVQTATVSAAVGGMLALTAPVSFTVGPANSTSSTLVAASGTVTADGTSTTLLTVTVRDAFGRPIPGHAVLLTSTGSANALTPASGVTDGAGTFTALLASTVAEPKDVMALIDGFVETASVTFVAAAPAAATTSLSTSPSALTADGASTTTLRVVVEDARGNPVPGSTVNLSVSGSNNALSPATGTTDAAGVFTATLASTKAETKTVTATVGGITKSQTVTFFAGAASSATSSFSVAPGTVTADGSSAATLQVAALDAQNNPLSGQAVSVAVSGAGNGLVPATGTTNAAGVFTATLTSTVAELKNVTATFGGFSKPGSVTFVPGAPSAATSSLSSSTASVTADNTSTTTLTVTVRDAQGNPIAGKVVTLSSTGANNGLSPASGISDTAGVFVTTLRSSTAEAKTVTAAFDGVNISTGITFVAGSPSGATTTLLASPTTVTADGTSVATLTLTLRDAQGNPVPSQAATVSSTGTQNTLSPAVGSTDAAGLFVATLASSRAETKTVTVVSGGVTKTTPISFVAGVPSSVMTAFTAGPTTVTADGAATTTLTVTVQDAQGNPVLGQSVSFSGTGTANSFSATSGTTSGAGIFAATLASSQAEAKHLTATVGAFTKTADVTFVAGAPSASTSTLAANPTSLTADGSGTSTLTFTVRDAQGNPVPSQAISLSSSGTANTGLPASGTTDAAGVFTATLASTRAESKTVSAVAGGVTKTAGVTFVAGPASATTSMLVASPASVPADNASATTLTLTVEDAHGNLVAGQAVSLASSGFNNVLSSASGNTDAGGVFTATLRSSTAQTKTVTATVGVFVETADVVFTVGVPSSAHTSVVASPASVTADGVSTTSLTVTVEDAQGNPVPSQVVSLASTGSGNIFAPATGSTNAAGVFSTTLASSVAEAKTITATAGPATATTSVSFVAGAPSGGTTTLAAAPTSVAADGSSQSTLTVTVLDAQGNPVAGQAVSLAATGTNNTLTPASGTSSAAGVVTATFASTTAELKTVTATLGGISKTADVTFTVPTISTTNSSLVASPNALVADGTTSTTLTVSVRDASNAAVVGQTVTFSGTGTANAFSATSGVTDASGLLTVTLSSTKAEAKTLTATVNGASLTAAVTFSADAPVSAQTTLSASPTSLTADNTATTTLTVTVKDANGNPVPGQSVTLASSGSANTLTPTSGNTDAAGRLTATLRSSVAETKTVTATAGAIVKTTNVTFAAGAPSAATSTFTASPTSLTANGTSTSTVTVTVLDAQGNPVASQAVSLASSGTANTFTPASGSTNAAGVFTATLASTRAEAKTVTATAGSLTKNATVTFVAGAPSGTTTTFVAGPSTVIADGASASTLTLTVLDAQGNPVAGQAVSVASNGTGNTLAPASGNTDAAGMFTATLKSTKAELKTVTATAGSVTKNATVTFSAGAPSSAATTFVIGPASATANGTSTVALTVTVADVNGNAVAAQAVTLTSTGSNNTFGAGSGSTDASGTFTTTLASTKAEAKTVTATVGAVVKTAGATFVAGAPAALTSDLAASPTSLTANGTSTTTLTLTVKDAQGNPVASQAVSLASSGSANTFGSSTGATDANGLFTTTLKSTVAETKVVTGTAGAVNETANVTFVAGPASATTTTLTASPTSLTADGNSTTTLTLTVRDAQGNAISGQSVSLAVDGTSNTLAPTSGTTGATGVFTATLRSTKAEGKTVTATVAAFTVTTGVTFVAGAPAAVTTAFMASPTSVTADGSSTSALTFTVLDAQGNPVAGQAVSLACDGSSNTLSPTSGSTNAAGIFAATLASAHAEVKTVTATAGAVVKTRSVTFVAGAMSSLNSSVVASPGIVTADNVSTTNVTVTVQDAQGNPIANQAVALATSGTGNTLGSNSGSTDATGKWTTTLKASKAESKTLTATVGATNLTSTVSFVAGAASATTSTLVANPTSLADDGVATTTLTTTVLDAQSNPVPGQAVTLSASGSGNTFSATWGSTDSTGVFTATLKSTVAQTETATATIGAINVSTSVTFTLGTPSASQSSVTASPTSVAADGASTTTLTVTAKDGTGNLIAGQPVSLSSSGTNNTFGSSSGNTNGSGVFTTTLKSTTVETKTITATLGAITAQTTVSFYASTPSSATSTFTASPNSVTADGTTTTTLTVTAKDAVGNPTSNVSVTLSSTGTGNVIASATGTTDAQGKYSTTMTSTKAESKTVTASFTVVLTAPVTFVAGAPAKLAFTTSPAASRVGPCALTTGATVAIQDAQGNTCSAATNSISVAIGANPNSAALGGTTSVAATAGSASFTTLTVSRFGTGYTLVASSGVLTQATSASFNISTACPVQTTATSVGIAGITGISAGDFDKDGFVDVAVASSTNKTVKILYGDGKGSFGARTFQPSVTAAFTNIVTPDFNGDGYADLAMTNATASSNAGVVYLNDKAGGFSAATNVALGANANTITAVDIDRDGDLDLVAGGPSSMTWVLNSGTGTFGGTNTLALTGPVWYPWRMTIGGTTGYGYVSGTSSLTARVQAGASSTSSGAGFIVAAMGAWQGGWQHVALSNKTTIKPICWNSSMFDSSSSATTNANGRYIGMADMSADGNADAIVAMDTGIGVHLAYGSGSTCGFKPITSYATSHTTVWVATGDFNGDGKMDMVAANYDDDSVTAVLRP
jgi:adhesin/invasin